MGETMFEKEKPKRQLTKKQQEALKRGRDKLKAKRQGDDFEEVKQIKTKQKHERLAKLRVMDEKREADIYNKLMKKGNDKIDKFKTLKYKWLDQAPDMKHYQDFKGVLDTITEEDILKDQHIEKLKHSLHGFRKSSAPIDIPKKNVRFEIEDRDIMDDMTIVD